MANQRTRAHALDALKLLLRRSLPEPHTTETPAERAVLDGLDAEQFVRVSSVHGVGNLIARAASHPDVSSRLDPDLVAFLEVLRDSNRERNAALKRQLLALADVLHRAGVPVVALKGGAELLQPVFDDTADRLQSDIDILVPRPRIDDALAVLKAAGYTDHDRPYDRMAKHAPALWHDDHLTGVEVHTDVSVGIGALILPADEILARAEPTAWPGLRVPSMRDRLCHLVTHAQIDSARYENRLLLLRDVAELHALARRLTADDWHDVRDRFREHGCLEHYEAFVTIATDVIGRRVGPGEETLSARQWADETWHSLLTPGRHRWRVARGFIKWYALRLRADPLLVFRLAAALTSPTRVRRYLQHKRALMRSYQ